MFQRSTLAIAIISMLSACGGSGSSSKAEQSNSNSSSVLQNTLAVKAVYKDACGNETVATDAALLIHNSDFSNEQIVYPDVNGEMLFQTDSDHKSISLVMRGKYDVDGVKPVILTTFVDHPVIDMGTYSHYTGDSSSCDCQSTNLKVNIPARVNDRGNARLSDFVDYNSVENSIGHSDFYNVNYCKNESGHWPKISAIADFSSPEESFAAVIPDISTVDSIDALLEGTVVNVFSPFSTRQVSAYFDGNYHLRSYAFNENDNVYTYPIENVDFYTVSAYQFESIYDVPNIDNAFVFASNRVATEDINQTFDLPINPVDYSKLFDILISESGSYDISDIASVDYMGVNIEARHDGESMFDWFMFAPPTGQVPSIENIDISEFISEQVLNNSVNTLEMQVSASAYEGINGYDDFLKSNAERTIEDQVSSKWSNRQYTSLEIETSDVIFTSLSSMIPTQKMVDELKTGKSKMLTKSDNHGVER